MEDISAYEGLVAKTSFLFAAQVGLEQEDMRQELRLKIVKAQRSFDPTRSKMTERAYVYSCVVNFTKDLKKLAARRSVMRVGYIEDQPVEPQPVSEEEAFTMLDQFTWPSTVSDQEKRVAVLLIVGYSHQEAADLLDVAKTEVTASLKNLREKLADWRLSPNERTAAPAPLAAAPSLAVPAPPVPAPLPVAPVVVAV